MLNGGDLHSLYYSNLTRPPKFSETSAHNFNTPNLGFQTKCDKTPGKKLHLLLLKNKTVRLMELRLENFERS